MLELNFIEEYLKETVHAIKSLVKNKKVITVKSVRKVNNIKSSNRSKIEFFRIKYAIFDESVISLHT